MFDDRFFDYIARLISQGNSVGGLHFLAGALVSAKSGKAARAGLRAHQLHQILLLDPFVARAFNKSPGYAGDAGLIDMLVDRHLPEGTGDLGRQLFAVTSVSPLAQAMRDRVSHASTALRDKLRADKSVLALACGHLREADGLKREDLSQLVAVDPEPLALARIRAVHGDTVTTIAGDPLTYLRAAARDGARFDYIYTSGLTDYLDDRAVSLLHHLMHRCLNPGGTLLVTNFLPDHMAVGWLDAVMNWPLVYRTETELHGFAAEIEMESRSWRDSTESIAWCEMKAVI